MIALIGYIFALFFLFVLIANPGAVLFLVLLGIVSFFLAGIPFGMYRKD